MLNAFPQRESGQCFILILISILMLILIMLIFYFDFDFDFFFFIHPIHGLRPTSSPTPAPFRNSDRGSHSRHFFRPPLPRPMLCVATPNGECCQAGALYSNGSILSKPSQGVQTPRTKTKLSREKSSAFSPPADSRRIVHTYAAGRYPLVIFCARKCPLTGGGSEQYCNMPAFPKGERLFLINADFH